jgi:hypothetical protein
MTWQKNTTTNMIPQLRLLPKTEPWQKIRHCQSGDNTVPVPELRPMTESENGSNIYKNYVSSITITELLLSLRVRTLSAIEQQLIPPEEDFR